MSNNLVFPSKHVDETPRYTFDFTDVIPASSTLFSYEFDMQVFSGIDDGELNSMIVDSSAVMDSPTVAVNVQLGTVGVVYNLICIVQLDDANGPIYRKAGKIAVLNGNPYVNATSSMTLSISPTFQQENGADTFPSLLFPDPFTATPTAGVAPYFYDWTVASTDPAGQEAAWTFADAESANVNPRYTISGQGTFTATLECTVTDSTGATASATCSAIAVISGV